jgi:hypothetical protein
MLRAFFEREFSLGFPVAEPFRPHKRSQTRADQYAHVGFGHRWTWSVCVDGSGAARMDEGVKEA